MNWQDLFRALGVKTGLALKYLVIWVNGAAAGEMRLGENIFRIRKAGNAYALNRVDGSSERELVKIDAKDPQFAIRLLVAIGDAF